MFDAAEPEVMLRFLLLAIPLLVLAVLLAVLYMRYPGAPPPEETARKGGDRELPPLSLRDPEAAVESAVQIEARLAEMEKGGDQQALAAIYLALGRSRLNENDEQRALSALRSAAGIAARHGPPGLHGEARMELAEAALRAGDPTGACEQWQMARMAFLDAGAKVAGDNADKRMRANGCPTDWVLTDF